MKLETKRDNDLRNLEARVFKYKVPKISPIYTLVDESDDITAMMAASSLNQSVTMPLDSNQTITHTLMGASSVGDGYLPTEHADQMCDLTAGHTNQE